MEKLAHSVVGTPTQNRSSTIEISSDLEWIYNDDHRLELIASPSCDIINHHKIDFKTLRKLVYIYLMMVIFMIVFFVAYINQVLKIQAKNTSPTIGGFSGHTFPRFH